MENLHGNWARNTRTLDYSYDTEALSSPSGSIAHRILRDMFTKFKPICSNLLHDYLVGAGTACIVCPIKKIHYEGHDIHVPLDPSDKTSQAGKLTKRINDAIMDIQYGDKEGPKGWSVVV